jgi:hypothetical protein
MRTFRPLPRFRYGQNNADYALKHWNAESLGGGRMNMDDSRLIARFQRLTTELLIEKRLGQRRPELTGELCQTWLELDQRGLKDTPEYRNVMLSADRHAFWLAGLVRLSRRCCAPRLLKRNRAHRHAERLPGRVTDGNDSLALRCYSLRTLSIAVRYKANAHERANAIHRDPFRPRTDCWDHVADCGHP